MFLDATWVDRANELVSSHRTGAVDEFRVCLAIEEPSGTAIGWIVAEGGGVRFSAHPLAADCTIRLDRSLVERAFDFDDQEDFVDLAFRDGGLQADGDLARARFFMQGLVRGAPPELVRSLRALPT